jgi:exodeoxyribonuclease VIII
MNRSEYDAIIALNNSGMNQLERSPAHYIAWRDSPKKTTPAQLFGIAAHVAVLEPDKFFEYDDLLPDTTIRAINKMREAVMRHPNARSLIETSEHEVVKVWDRSGCPCKGIADGVIRSNNLKLVEFKTTRDASQFERDFIRYKYHRQAAFYFDGFCAQESYVIAVEKDPPYGVRVFALTPNLIEQGRALYEPMTRLYKRCMDDGVWPGYENGISLLSGYEIDIDDNEDGF